MTMIDAFDDYIDTSLGTGKSAVAVIVTSVLLGLFASLRWWPAVGFVWAFYGFGSFALGYLTCMQHIKDTIAERRPTE